jgi:DNA-binding ferritin-like protein
MAKKKAAEQETKEDSRLWDNIVASINEDNKEDVLSQLQSALEFLEQTKDKKTADKVKETIKRIG